MPSSFNSAIKSLIQSLGYEVIPRWRLENYQLATHLTRLFRLYEVDCVFDVGANRGQYRDMLRNEVGYHGQIISFEPLSHNIELLEEQTRRDDKWAVVGVALGSENGTRKINVMADSQFSSFLSPDHGTVDRFKIKNAVVSVETVPIRRLDGLFAEAKTKYGFDRPYLKLDTQGFDLEVAAGAGAALETFRALQFEASALAIYRDMPAHFRAIDHFVNVGFDLSGMFPISQDDSLRLIEYDCVMVNRGMATQIR